MRDNDTMLIFKRSFEKDNKQVMGRTTDEKFSFDPNVKNQRNKGQLPKAAALSFYESIPPYL
jgi:hypothetical protein